jgi:hypothetical protein
MGGNYFDHIAQELLKQKQYMDTLATENRELRQQLAGLLSGRGIFLDIQGTRFPLYSDALETRTVSPTTATLPSIMAIPKRTHETQPTNPQQVQALPEYITTFPEVKDKKHLAETPIPDPPRVTTQTLVNGTSTFLEEIMVDEFANALASPGSIWQTPPERKRTTQKLSPTTEAINEEQKAALRKELIGSFLLE